MKSGFQPLVFHGKHPQQPYKNSGATTYSVGPEDDSMRVCLDLKGETLSFKEGDVIGAINPKTGETEFNEQFLAAVGNIPCMSDDMVTPNIKHTSIVDEIMELQNKERSAPKVAQPFHRVNSKSKKHRRR